MYNILGGYLFLVEGNGTFHFDGQMIKAFVWIPKVTMKILELGNCIELDASFKAVEPGVFCAPMMIYRNTGLPMGLIVGPTECSEMYSLFYEALNLIDRKEIDHEKIAEIEIDPIENESEENNRDSNQEEIPQQRLFNLLIEKYVLKDQHRSFEKLQSNLHFELFYCYVHLIRSFGSSSSISILVREILFCKSIAEFESRFSRIRQTFKLFLEIGGSAVKHYDKFIKIFGFDEERQPVERDPKMEPLFIRMNKMVPSSTNHIERFHRYVNSSIEDAKNCYKRLGILFQCIKHQIDNYNNNLLPKLRDYLINLRSNAEKIIDEDPERLSEFSKETCDDPYCLDGSYYINLYQCELPCQHQIMNKRWNNCDYNALIEFKIDELDLGICDNSKAIVGLMEDRFESNSINEKTDDKSLIDYNLSNTTDHFDSIYANTINRCFIQLKSVMGKKIKLEEVAGYACEEQTLMLQDESLINLYQNNPDDYMILLSVRIIKHCYEQKI